VSVRSVCTAVSLVVSGRQQMSLQIDTSDVDYELLREREDALQQLEVRRLLVVLDLLYYAGHHLSSRKCKVAV